MRYRVKPKVIEAWKVGEEKQPWWMNHAITEGIVWYQGGEKPYYTVKTLEGEMRADAGNYIIRGIRGELYPCRADIFEQTYEAE